MSFTRTLAGRVSGPARSFLEQLGDMMLLTGRTVVSTVRPPYPYGGEFVSEFLFTLRLVWFPLLITTVAIDYGAPGLQAANFLTILGALDRLGGFFVLAAIREIGPLITSIVIAGVAGTSITADLGARKVREELDALQVLGVDPVKNLVVPRFLALMLATGLFDIYALLFGISSLGIAFLASYIAVVKQVGYTSSGGYLLTFWQFQNPPDVLFSLIKGMSMATVIVLVGCYYGYNASGGPVGVGRATAKSMVLNLVLVTLIGMLGTQVFWGANPRAPIGG